MVINFAVVHESDWCYLLTLCMLGNFSCFCCHLLTFFKSQLFKKILSDIRLSNSLDTDQERKKIGPDLCPNCLQRLLADGKRSL